MEVRLDGRTALITGASQGLGRAMAERFARSGGRVVMVARNADRLEEARRSVTAASADDRAIALAGDVSTAEGCERIVAAALERCGQIDILVNNAGSSARGPFLEITDEMWQSDFDLKLFAAIRLCRGLIPGMRTRKWGRIINVLNIGAKAPQPGSAPTAVSRAAGLSLTKILSQDFAADNILVNALLVGKIDSEQWRKRHAALKDGTTYEQYLDKSAKAENIPMGRVGRAEEFADMACFLASDHASYITGVAINVDGGRSPIA